MIKKHYILAALTIVLFFTACTDHLISDEVKRKEIHHKFTQRCEQLLFNRQEQLLAIFDTKLTAKEREALEFLYAYETLSDLSNYDSDYYLQQVRYALIAQQTFTWGGHPSEEDFLHFVLAPRAGTENLDSARAVIFNEVKERIMHLSMKDAAMEVNHWCHEKVTYVGSDSRTSAPLATIKNAKGRCGEESAFTVTALRAVGIPARQIYTPRWVHQDDNHAWVEFWADGEWYFLGACEPEADVNQGWFVEPTRRAILTATQTPGNYSASDVIYKRENFTRLNQISNYATAKDIYVKVLDKENEALADAEVGFLVCNYAELYNLAPLKTNKDGLCRLKLGLGDVIVWVNNNNEFSFQKVTVADTDTVTLKIDGSDFSERVLDIDLVPPVKKEPLKVSAEGKAINKKRLAHEDSIRSSYENTFMSKEAAFGLAQQLELDTTQVWQKIKKSRGNWKDIARFMKETPAERKEWIMPLLGAVSKKDLHDATADILLSHINHTVSCNSEYSEEEYVKYVLNPRVELEQLSSYKAYLMSKFKADFWSGIKDDPQHAERWILDNISISKTENYIWVPAIPQGVFEMKIADMNSAKLFFVALCRTAGIASRVNPVTKIAQYKKDSKWTNVYLGESQPVKEDSFGSIGFVEAETNAQACRYYKHFSLAKFENGKYTTLEYDFKKHLKDFPDRMDLAVGNYLLFTAEREEDGTVLSRLSFFTLTEGEYKDVIVSLRNDGAPLQSKGKFHLPPSYNMAGGELQQLQSYMMKQGSVIVWLDPDKEPTKHVLKDFEDLTPSFDALNVPFVFVLPDDDRSKVFNKADYTLPSNALFVKDNTLLPHFSKAIGSHVENQLPVLTMVSGDNEILFLSSGYKIGVGDQLLKVLKKYVQ